MRRRIHISLLGLGLLACSSDPAKPPIQMDAATDSRDAPAVVKDAPVNAGDVSVDAGSVPVDAGPVDAGDALAAGDTAVDSGASGHPRGGGPPAICTSTPFSRTTPRPRSRCCRSCWRRPSSATSSTGSRSSNHLRVSDKDHAGNAVPGGPIPLSKGDRTVRNPRHHRAAARGDLRRQDDLLVGRVGHADPRTLQRRHRRRRGRSDAALKALNQFEYLFTNRDAGHVRPRRRRRLGHPALAHHPRRRRAGHRLAEAAPPRQQLRPDQPPLALPRPVQDRRLPRAQRPGAPDVVFAIEGMVGNQMEPDRGGYASRVHRGERPLAHLRRRRLGDRQGAAASGTRCWARAAGSGASATPTTTSRPPRTGSAAATSPASTPGTTSGSRARACPPSCRACARARPSPSPAT